MDFNSISVDGEKQTQFSTTTFSSSYDFPLPMAPTPFPNPNRNRRTLTPFPTSSSSDSQFELKAGVSILNESPADLPKPLESLQETPIPPFLSKTYDLVDDPSLDGILSWGEKGNTFVVWKPLEFARLILPRNFKHGNFSSFVRQLNTYGFRKIGVDKWEFASEGFVKGQRHLLRTIKRRGLHQTDQTGSVNGTGKPALEGEIACLRKERSLMMQELAQLQHEQCGTAQHVETVKEKLEMAEKRQKQMASFLAKMLQKPSFLSCIKQARKQKTIGSTGSARKCLKLQEEEPGASSTLLSQPKPCNSTAPSQVESIAHEEVAVIDQPWRLNDCPASFPGDMVTGLPKSPLAGVASMGIADVWDKGYEACTDIYTSYDTLTNGDVLGLDISNADLGLNEIWGIDPLHSAGGLGFERCLDRD